MSRRIRRIVLCVIVSLLLYGCASDGYGNTTAAPSETTGAVSAGDLLCFPGLSWDMTREEVIRALALTEADYAETEKYLLRVPGFSCFGREDAELVCYFTGNDLRMELCLEWVQVIFPDDADMAAVKGEAEMIYGAPDESCGQNQAASEEEMYHQYQQTGFPLKTHLTDDHHAYWMSDVSMADYLGSAGTEAYLENFTDIMPDTVKKELLESKAAFWVLWSDDAGRIANPTQSKNFVLFFAGRVHEMNRTLAELQE